MAYGVNLEATYQDGYVHSEAALKDQSPYEATANIFNDILNHRPESDHGKLITFSIVADDGTRHDIDWTNVPESARPLYYREMQLIHNTDDGVDKITALRHVFGHQYNDDNGQNVQEVVEL